MELNIFRLTGNEIKHWVSLNLNKVSIPVERSVQLCTTTTKTK